MKRSEKAETEAWRCVESCISKGNSIFLLIAAPAESLIDESASFVWYGLELYIYTYIFFFFSSTQLMPYLANTFTFGKSTHTRARARETRVKQNRWKLVSRRFLRGEMSLWRYFKLGDRRDRVIRVVAAWTRLNVQRQNAIQPMQYAKYSMYFNKKRPSGRKNSRDWSDQSREIIPRLRPVFKTLIDTRSNPS